MAIGFTMSVAGDKALLARLQALRGPKIKAILRKTTRKGARLLWAEAKSRAPVGPTGNYRRQIKMRTKVLKDGNVATMVRATAPHAALVEMGSKERMQKATGRCTGRMPAMAVMEQAARAKGQQAADLVMQETAAEIERAASGR